jgi:hypothetical protein
MERAAFMEDLGHVVAAAFGKRSDHTLLKKAEEFRAAEKDPLSSMRAWRGGMVHKPDGSRDLIIPKHAVRRYRTEAERREVIDELKRQGRLVT